MQIDMYNFQEKLCDIHCLCAESFVSNNVMRLTLKCGEHYGMGKIVVWATL